MGDLLLFPTWWTIGPFKHHLHPACLVCKAEILPMTPVEIDRLEDNRVMVYHKDCFTDDPVAV